VMIEILACRLQMANLLGFENFAQQSLVEKMVKSPQQVLAFLDELAKKSKRYAQTELTTLKAFAKDKDGLNELCAWDTAYYSEALCQAEYAVSQEALRPYFPQAKVLAGMFALMQRLYGITIAEQHDFSSWHEDVRLFSVLDNQGQLKAQFYLDLYARKQKRGGAWMDECRVRYRLADGSVQLPVAFLVCNFSAPVADKPALFTHDEVVTLFHEFGHGLQHMLTQVDELPVSGINGVPWDAVELPSQFNEHWCWQKEVLPMISGHYQTGEPLPEAMIDKLIAARHFQAAMQMLRQLEFATFDMRLHQVKDRSVITSQWVQEVLDTVRYDVAVVSVPAYNRFQHGFSHIFAGGYAAGYYSYKWAEVLASDAFARFEEEGLFNPKVGHDFLRYVLEPGGTREPLELFVEFRGREPSIDPLLRHHGMV
jgi:oligopeptidase A